MNPITEKNYPVEVAWIFKSLVGTVVVLLILLPFTFLSLTMNKVNIYFIFYLIVTPVNLLVIVLRRKNFHYTTEDKFLTLKQGIFNKQQRHIPYGVIQNIYVKQDLLDRVFGLSSLTLENASAGGGVQSGEKKFLGMKVANNREQNVEAVGFSGNKVSIPGLRTNNAEILKGIVLQKMKENPMEDSNSGL